MPRLLCALGMAWMCTACSSPVTALINVTGQVATTTISTAGSVASSAIRAGAEKVGTVGARGGQLALQGVEMAAKDLMQPAP